MRHTHAQRMSRSSDKRFDDRILNLMDLRSSIEYLMDFRPGIGNQTAVGQLPTNPMDLWPVIEQLNGSSNRSSVRYRTIKRSSVNYRIEWIFGQLSNNPMDSSDGSTVSFYTIEWWINGQLLSNPIDSSNGSTVSFYTIEWWINGQLLSNPMVIQWIFNQL